MNEAEVSRVLGSDLSIGTDAFRESLLRRCLSVLGSDDEGVPLADDDLDWLAAAGSPELANLPTDPTKLS